MLVNLTPHSINIISETDSRVIPPSGTVARCSEHSERVGEVDGVPLYLTSYGPVFDLPERADGLTLIVSALVRLALPERLDLASPGALVRDANGQPVGCRGLVINRS